MVCPPLEREETATFPGEMLDVLGTTLRVEVSQADANFSLLEVRIPPGVGVPLHSHPEAESFYVLSGELEFAMKTNDEVTVRPVLPGQTVFIPREIPHSFKNVTDADTRVLVIAEPGLEQFFLQAGRGPATVGAPTPDHIARVVAIAESLGQRFYGPHPER